GPGQDAGASAEWPAPRTSGEKRWPDPQPPGEGRATEERSVTWGAGGGLKEGPAQMETLPEEEVIKLAKKPFCEAPVDSRLLMMNSRMETLILPRSLHLN
ncbi:Hypothetical predicted protein, partial [Marmota monax]